MITSRGIKLAATAGALVVLLVGGSLTLSSCSTTIESGEVGILTTKYGPNPGVQLTELPPGWHWEGIGEKITPYKIRQGTYSYTREANADGKENEEIGFSDMTGLPMTADVNLSYRVQGNKAADLYTTWRTDITGLLEGQIRNDIRAYIARESEKVPVSCAILQASTEGKAPATCTASLLGGGRQAVLERAFSASSIDSKGNVIPSFRDKWAVQGVIIDQLTWLGTIRYPDTIVQAIQNRTAIEQRTLAAQQREAEARANAQAAIETAKGEAESIRLRAEALRAAPELIDQIYAQRSQGLCPPRATTCIIGQGAWGLTNQRPSAE